MTFLANPAHILAIAMAEVIEPPPPIDFQQWAVDNINFSKRESPSFPGPYNPDLFPFFTEVLKALSPDDPCRTVSLQKSAQIGGTILANVFVLGTQGMDPCDFMYILPTENNATRWSKLKLKPMLRSAKSLLRVFPERSRDGGDSILFKERADGRGSILISGANSPASLSMVTVSRQVQDDLSKWTVNEAGDPEQQADSRSRGSEFAKLFKISTPLVMPGCKISKNYTHGSQEEYHVPCPHCGHMHALEWGNMLANLDEDHPEEACFTCPECGTEINEHHRAAMVRKGRWVAKNPKAKKQHRSFYLWSAYAPLQSWRRIAEEWFKAKGDPASERVFLNDAVGLAYDEKGEAPPWEELKKRADESDLPRGLIPIWGVVLTLGIDCQKDRVEWQLIAWGRDNRRHVVDVGVITGHISEAETRKGLDSLLGGRWKHLAGRLLQIDLAAIDGNAWTEDVWDWVKKHPASKVIMVRGVGSEAAPLLARVKRERDRKGKLIAYSRRFYNFATSVLKMALYRNAAKIDPMERGYVGFPQGLDDEYFKQLTSEHRKAVKRRDGFLDYKWVKDPTQANEALDTMLQAEAAALRLNLRILPDREWDRLEKERASPLEDAQMDLEEVGLVATAVVSPAKTAIVLPRRAAPRKPARGGFVNGWK
jgi:phage terminase large subunit GpA-like protein